MKGRWRLFRHDAGRVAGPPGWVYAALFAVSLAIGNWSAVAFGMVTVWLANGVLAAALLQLHRRQAIQVLIACFAMNLLSNILRGDPGVFLWINALLNLGEAMLAAVLARRVCGAALDLRRPRRLIRFTLLAALPAVVLSASVAMGLTAVTSPQPLAAWVFSFQNYIVIEVLGLLLITPSLLMLADGHRFDGATRASRPETAALIGLMLAVTGAVFWLQPAPVAFLPFLPMILIAFRLSPPGAAASLMAVAVISGAATLTGHGPVQLAAPLSLPGLEHITPMARQMGVYNLFMLSMVITVLPISTVMTERRRLEDRLRARTAAAHEARRCAEDAAAARSRFLAMMSHEMRTPLNAVAGFADLLAGRPGLDGEAVRQARQIRESSDGLLMLVEDILDFARADDALSPEPVDLAAVAGEAAAASRPTAAAKGLSLVVDDRLPARARFVCDRRALRQALHPLIANAVKFTETGGVTVRLDPSASGVRIQVSDTGCGVDPEVRPELFEVFAQGDASIGRSHAGVGLGLALVMRQVRRMNGQIAVDSAPGEGATFALTLPLARAVDGEAPTAPTATPAISPAAVVEADARAPTVLVVDDHPVNREVARIMLEAFGCDVVEACDGHEALEAVGRHAPDLVLMDVRMPGMDGLEATRRLRAAPGEVSALPIVAMTADAMPEDVARCLAAGMNAHLAKPISQVTLFAAVNQALSEAAARADAA